MSNKEFWTALLIEIEDCLWKLAIMAMMVNQLYIIWDIQEIQQEIGIHDEIDSLEFPVPPIQMDDTV